MEFKTLGAMMRLVVEVSNCRILYVKDMGVYEQYHTTREVIQGLGKVDEKES